MKVSEIIEEIFEKCCSMFGVIFLCILDVMLLCLKYICKQDIKLPSDQLDRLFFVFNHIGDYALFALSWILFFAVTLLLFIIFFVSGITFKDRQSDDTKLTIIIKAIIPIALLIADFIVF